jgi:ATP adenylyltransferase
VLNKFSLVPLHFLIVTKEFEEQTSRLNASDLSALVESVELLDSPFLAFYNSGKESGASQPHKHLQVIPMESEGLPIEPQLKQAIVVDGVGSVPAFHFKHGVVHLATWNTKTLLDAYTALTCVLQVTHEAYNLIVTREHMLMVLRSRERTVDGRFTTNALGYAGYLMAVSEQDATYLEHSRILDLLTQLAMH